MNKVKVSKDWTPAERLQLINELVQHCIRAETLLTPWQMQDVRMISGATSEMLEANRQAFKRYLKEGEA